MEQKSMKYKLLSNIGRSSTNEDGGTIALTPRNKTKSNGRQTDSIRRNDEYFLRGKPGHYARDWRYKTQLRKQNDPKMTTVDQ